MKREEKNQQTRRKIMESALAEFSREGYAGASMNAICSAPDISKGIIYHYFKSKDGLFLECIRECFELLTQELRERMKAAEGTPRTYLEIYFRARMDFFESNPVYRGIFCEAVITPPAHLYAEIQKLREGFDTLNRRILERLLAHVELRRGITAEEVAETIRLFQDFVNAGHQYGGTAGKGFQEREERCRKIIDILLYGVVERMEETE